MSKLRTNWYLFFFYALASLSFGADTLNGEFPQIKKIRAALNQIKPFKVHFIQEVFTDDQEQADIRESGEILFKNDRLLKWTYLDPDYKVFLLEEDNYRFYDEDNEQLIIGKIKDRNQQWIWQLLFSEDLSRYSHVKWDETHKKIQIKHDPEAAGSDAGNPGDMNIDVEVTVSSNFLPVKMLQKDPSGARIVYHFKEYKSHIDISNDTFQLNVPEEVEIIRE